MDKLSKEKRSWNMSRIRSKHTKPEITVRKILSSKGYRYRLHYKISGRPDIVFIRQKIAVFVQGCFWHGHTCIDGHIPKTNSAFWKNKIKTNQMRDKKSAQILKKLEWKVFVLHECEIEKKPKNKLMPLLSYLSKKYESTA